tara:strand:+ start:349 stop:654 length:306 start_codon:yes stop_codon:yes gene_type:complete
MFDNNTKKATEGRKGRGGDLRHAHLVAVSLSNSDHQISDEGNDSLDGGLGLGVGKPHLDEDLLTLADHADVSAQMLEAFGQLSARTSDLDLSVLNSDSHYR